MLGLVGNWTAFLLFLIALLAIGFDTGQTNGIAMLVAAVAVAAVTHVALFALMAARLRDAGRSGWWALLLALPLSSVLWSLESLIAAWFVALVAGIVLPAHCLMEQEQ